jgi:AraC-like DNA-binding protein
VPTGSTSLVRLPLHLLRQTDKEGLDRAGPTALTQPGIGVRFGAEVRVRDVGLVGYLMLHSRTLGEALSRLVRFGRILENADPPALVTDGARVEYRWEPYRRQVAMLDRLSDHELAAHLAVIRELVGVDLRPAVVRFRYDEPPSDLSAHRDFFQAPLEFGAGFSGLVFRREHLDLPIRSADESLGLYLERYAEEILEHLAPEGGLLEKVERALWSEMKEGHIDLEHVAAMLAMRPRTLQRRLRDFGTSFSELRDEFRRRMARLLLEDRELAVYEVAFLLGYSEPSTFYRAFRRWTDTSPHQYRSAGPWLER